jgi:glycine/D-amino acid oxidase-like deaminating enzyme
MTVRAAGVELLEQCEVQGIEPLTSGYRVETSRGVFETERVIDAGDPRGARRIAEFGGSMCRWLLPGTW